jgi:hypothetical protein
MYAQLVFEGLELKIRHADVIEIVSTSFYRSLNVVNSTLLDCSLSWTSLLP